MATVKIKFRPSTVDGGQGSIFYQVIHNRVARQQKTGYRLYGYEDQSLFGGGVTQVQREQKTLSIGDWRQNTNGCQAFPEGHR